MPKEMRLHEATRAMETGGEGGSGDKPPSPEPPAPPPPPAAGAAAGEEGEDEEKGDDDVPDHRTRDEADSDSEDDDSDDEPEAEADVRAAAAAAARARQAEQRVYTDPEAAEDLRGQPQTAADRKLMEVYGGDTVHQNDGRHLHGGVDNDEEMCWLYEQVVSHPHPL
jgi:hypothetical protein